MNTRMNDDELIRRGDALALIRKFSADDYDLADISDAIAALPAVTPQPAPDDWKDVLVWTDIGEKTLFDWSSGGGDPAGEFGRLGLRREMPDGSVLYRTYVATGPWGDPAPMPQPAPDVGALVKAAKRSAEGWTNAIELGIIPPQNKTSAGILRDELNAALAAWEGRGNE